MITSRMVVIHGTTISPTTIEEVPPIGEMARATTHQTVMMAVKVTEMGEAGIEGEETKEAVVGNGSHDGVATRNAAATPQINLPVKIVHQIDDQTTIPIHPIIEVEIEVVIIKAAEIGVEETQGEKPGFKGLIPVEIAPSSILKAIPVWTRLGRIVGLHPKLPVNRETTSIAIITRTRVTHIGKTATIPHENVMIVVEEVVDILVQVVGNRMRNNLMPKSSGLQRRRDGPRAFGLVILPINYSHALMAIMVVGLEWIGMALLVVEGVVAPMSMGNGNVGKYLQVIRRLT